MPQHRDQRVGVFVDVQNLYYSAKQFYHSKVNFAHILKKAVGNRQLVRAIAYVIKADIKEESNFFDALEKIGYDVRSKDLQTFYTGAKKGDWDVGIAMDIMRMASKLDVIVLCSGDGDFKDLLEHVKALGCRAEVIAFGKTSSSRILSEAEDFYDLGRELDKSLIKDHKQPDQKQDKNEIKPEAIEGEAAPVQVESPIQPPRQNHQAAGNRQQPMQPRPSFANNNRKPFQKREFKSFENGNKKPFQRQGFNRSEERDDEASFMQRINMDQPLPEAKPVNQPKRFDHPRPPMQGQRPFQKPMQRPAQMGQQKAQPPDLVRQPTKQVDMPKDKPQLQEQPKKDAPAKAEEKKSAAPKEKKPEAKPKKPKEKKPKAEKK